VGVGIVLFFLVFFLTVQIYDQPNEIDRIEISEWKYRALRAPLPLSNVNVIWLEGMLGEGTTMVSASASSSSSTMRTPSVTVMRWNKKPLCVTALDG